MASGVLEIASAICGMLGVGLLAIPAIYVARYASKAGYLARTRKQRHPGWEASVNETIADLREKQNAWDWRFSTALIAGTAFAFLAPLCVLLSIILR
jgi:hypothetical protein